MATSEPGWCSADTSLRRLKAGDESEVEAFLRAHSERSLFLRSNMRAAGLVDNGRTYEGTWVARTRDDVISDVICHAWNGNLLMQSPTDAEELARYAVRMSGRTVSGLIGPWDQVTTARAALGLDDAQVALAESEDLFSLTLTDLVVPALLSEDRVVCRRSTDHDIDRLAQWRRDYETEIFKGTRVQGLDGCRRAVQRLHDDGWLFVLVLDDQVVSMSAYNAVLPDCVQVGGVWTPPAWRSRGYARATVAGSLVEARGAGVESAILFTGKNNVDAAAAYRAIGFRVAGEYGLCLFRQEQAVDIT